jgi:hypothetical protein
MPWLEITTDDVLGAVNDNELTVAIQSYIAAGQSNPLPGTIAEKTAEVRGYVAVRNRLGVSGVPLELKATTIDLIVFDTLARISPDLAKRRIHWHDEAMKRLERVADGKFSVCEPSTPAVEQSQAPSPHFERRRLDFEKRDESGI